jgi:hypothetical protein
LDSSAIGPILSPSIGPTVRRAAHWRNRCGSSEEAIPLCAAPTTAPDAEPGGAMRAHAGR